MEKVEIFSGYHSTVKSNINQWIKKHEPIITRVIQSGSGNDSQNYICITIFYQDPLESPTNQ
jgi:hypothetical protein